MEAYQERVITEQKELAEKIVKLTTFITDINKTDLLSEHDFCLLRRQLETMLEYDRILQMRIIPFTERAVSMSQSVS